MKRTHALCILALLAVTAGCGKKETAESRGAADSAQTAAPPAATAASADSLARGPWHWIATVTPVERIACPDPARYTLEFLPDSLVAAQIDCNRGSGAYHLDGASLRVGPMAVTRMMCPPGSMDTKFAQQIDAARTWFMQGDTLMLDLFADSGTMRFVR